MTIEHEGGNRWQRLQPRERALIIIVGIIALLAIVYLLFLSGGEGTQEAFPTFTPRPGTPRPTPTATTTTPPETFEVFEGKDPFRPLVSDNTGGGTPAPSPGATPPSSGGASGSQRVTLVDISGSGSNRTATVEVNSTEYQVQEGDTFAGSYRVKDLTASCGTFVFGDEQFTLCVGQEVLK
jgi:hypothetical protein